MSPTSVELRYDASSDVLYAHLPGIRVRDSRAADNDGMLILDLAEDGTVAGLIVLEARDLALETWASHPDVVEVPQVLRQAVSVWLSAPPSTPPAQSGQPLHP